MNAITIEKTTSRPSEVQSRPNSASSCIVNDRAQKGKLVAKWLQDENSHLYCRWVVE